MQTKTNTCSRSVFVNKPLRAGPHCSEHPSLLWGWSPLHKVFPLSTAHIFHVMHLIGPVSLLLANQHTTSSDPFIQLRYRIAAIKKPFIITHRLHSSFNYLYVERWHSHGYLLITAALTCVVQHTHHPIPHRTQAGELGRASRTHHKSGSSTKSNSQNKSLWTYKAVEHGAGHPSCEAHVEERQGCAWMTRSLWSSSTTDARGAGITILLPAGASTRLVCSEPFFWLTPFLPPHPPPLPTPPFARPLLKRCSGTTHQSQLSFRNAPPPLQEWGESTCWRLKTIPVALLREGK